MPVADLANLPLLTKEIIRENLHELKAVDAVGLKRYNTGGSSGEPLVFYGDVGCKARSIYRRDAREAAAHAVRLSFGTRAHCQSCRIACSTLGQYWRPSSVCNLGASVDHQRAQIGSVFGRRVANGYGGRDAEFVAHECPHGGMHISAEDIIVEIVGPSGTGLPPGQEGEIVVTHLATKDFPFVRYRTGDVGALDESRSPIWQPI